MNTLTKTPQAIATPNPQVKASQIAKPQVDISDEPIKEQTPEVTLVVVPRERFSCTAQSLESLYANTRVPFNLIYVDGNSPPTVQQYLKTQAQHRASS